MVELLIHIWIFYFLIGVIRFSILLWLPNNIQKKVFLSVFIVTCIPYSVCVPLWKHSVYVCVKQCWIDRAALPYFYSSFSVFIIIRDRQWDGWIDHVNIYGIRFWLNFIRVLYLSILILYSMCVIFFLWRNIPTGT